MPVSDLVYRCLRCGGIYPNYSEFMDTQHTKKCRFWISKYPNTRGDGGLEVRVGCPVDKGVMAGHTVGTMTGPHAQAFARTPPHRVSRVIHSIGGDTSGMA